MGLGHRSSSFRVLRTLELVVQNRHDQSQARHTRPDVRGCEARRPTSEVAAFFRWLEVPQRGLVVVSFGPERIRFGHFARRELNRGSSALDQRYYRDGSSFSLKEETAGYASPVRQALHAV